MTIKKVAVIGAGMMGKGIAQVCTNIEEVEVCLYDVQEVDIYPDIEKSFNQLGAKGVFSKEEIDERMSRIHFSTDLKEAAGEADLVFECVFENLELKQSIFKQLEETCKEHAILATNTSVMSPTQISEKMKTKARFVGTHFWNPAYLIPLVEVVIADGTSFEVAQKVIDFLNRAGKKAVLCKKDVPGFIANRMQHALWREAISIVEHGIADAKTVDEAVKYSFGLRLPQLGPIENADMVGTDLTYNIHDYVLNYLEDSKRPSPVLTDLKDKGDLGFKTGKGFMEYTKEEIQASKDNLNEYLIKMIYGK
ncbi:MAG: 3-hydroxyacyl-CoA dehydrogenase family protein [Anaerostipes sp.]|jgi:3-hydroxybutyryl-CoA dehydrogenase|nr:3-hydroxyacyl-CoA dehydrogenase family protein [Anaerostipes sp.]